MRKAVTMMLALVVAAAGTATADKPKQEPSREESPASHTMPDMKEMMQRWTEVATPGPHHKLLDSFTGTWKATAKMWWGGPGTEPTVSEGTSTITWIMDGRYLMEKMSSRLPMPAADGSMKMVSFEGMGITGYDNFRKVYQTVWIDNYGTGMMAMTGSSDPAGKLFRYYGALDEPMLGVVGRAVRTVIRVVDADTHVMEMYDLYFGEDFKTMEITYKRVK